MSSSSRNNNTFCSSSGSGTSCRTTHAMNEIKADEHGLLRSAQPRQQQPNPGQASSAANKQSIRPLVTSRSRNHPTTSKFSNNPLRHAPPPAVAPHAARRPASPRPLARAARPPLRPHSGSVGDPLQARGARPAAGTGGANLKPAQSVSGPSALQAQRPPRPAAARRGRPWAGASTRRSRLRGSPAGSERLGRGAMIRRGPSRAGRGLQ